MANPEVSPDTFLVEIMIDGVPNYLLCGRLDGPLPADAIKGLSRERIEQLFRSSVRAAPLPTDRASLVAFAIPIQSMHHLFPPPPNP